MALIGVAKKQVAFANSGLVLSFEKRTSNLNFAIKGYDITVPIDYSRLEIINLLTHTWEDAKRGYVKQNIWENPTILLEGKLNCAQRIALSYYIMLSFLNTSECGTRDIWLQFRSVHRTVLSYLRNRAISNRLLLQYKVAILICHSKRYSIRDIPKIERTFERCGLSRQNYIFYLLFLLDRTLDKVTFEPQETFLLTVDSMENEAQDFINQPSISRICMYHTQKSLSFIVKSHQISPFDMVNELRMATQLAYITVRPLRCRAYSENYARRSMTNMVQRIIHAHTTYETKIRLVSTEYGYEGTHIFFNEHAANDFDPTWHHDNARASIYYSENDMIDYLDAKRTVAPKILRVANQ